MNKLQEALNKFTSHKCPDADYDLGWIFFTEANTLQRMVNKHKEAEVVQEGVSECCPSCKAVLDPVHNVNFCGVCGQAITRVKQAPRSQSELEVSRNNGSQPL